MIATEDRIESSFRASEAEPECGALDQHPDGMQEWPMASAKALDRLECLAYTILDSTTFVGHDPVPSDNPEAP